MSKDSGYSDSKTDVQGSRLRALGTSAERLKKDLAITKGNLERANDDVKDLRQKFKVALLSLEVVLELINTPAHSRDADWEEAKGLASQQFANLKWPK